ncbi:DNA glycosylase [Cyathus striatus]|nr:DNA glycosylase [Cyathus striatus]
MPHKRRYSSSQASTPSDGEGSFSELSDIESDFKPTRSNPKRKSSKLTSRAKSTKRQKIDEQRCEDSVASSRVPHCASLHVIDSVQPMRSALLAWFTTVRDNRRPEERGQRAYEVWISEIMLQQTQVSTVIPYYNSWMNRFPTIQALASASIDEVNALWKGLGYYSRASRLLSGAQKAMQSFNGKLPDNARDLEKNIPGIGRYSAGAISSIAYGERAPVLDGNVHRLLSRVLALYALPKAKKTLDILWSAAETFVRVEEEQRTYDSQGEGRKETEHPGDINQALIELGSTICTVRNPKCENCPIRRWCMAYQRSSGSDLEIIDLEDMCKTCEPIPDISDISLYPMKPIRNKWRQSEDSKDRLFLLIRRPEKGLLAGLFEFLTSENISKKLSKNSQEQLTLTFMSSAFPLLQLSPSAGGSSSNEGPRIMKIVPAGIIIHVFSHLKKSYHAQWVVIEGGTSPPIPKVNGVNNMKWVTFDEVEKANIGTGTLKVWKAAKSVWL